MLFKKALSAPDGAEISYDQPKLYDLSLVCFDTDKPLGSYYGHKRIAKTLLPTLRALRPAIWNADAIVCGDDVTKQAALAATADSEAIIGQIRILLDAMASQPLDKPLFIEWNDSIRLKTFAKASGTAIDPAENPEIIAAQPIGCVVLQDKSSAKLKTCIILPIGQVDQVALPLWPAYRLSAETGLAAAAGGAQAKELEPDLAKNRFKLFGFAEDNGVIAAKFAAANIHFDIFDDDYSIAVDQLFAKAEMMPMAGSVTQNARAKAGVCRQQCFDRSIGLPNFLAALITAIRSDRSKIEAHERSGRKLLKGASIALKGYLTVQQSEAQPEQEDGFIKSCIKPSLDNLTYPLSKANQL